MDFHYRVEGSWPFPLDMLRRDGAVPASSADQAEIERLSAEFAPDQDAIRTKTTISLVMRDAERRRPHTARWHSFGWSVPDDAEYRAAAEREAFRKKMEALRASALAKLTEDERGALEWFAAQERGAYPV